MFDIIISWVNNITNKDILLILILLFVIYYYHNKIEPFSPLTNEDCDKYNSTESCLAKPYCGICTTNNNKKCVQGDMHGPSFIESPCDWWEFNYHNNSNPNTIPKKTPCGWWKFNSSLNQKTEKVSSRPWSHVYKKNPVSSIAMASLN